MTEKPIFPDRHVLGEGYPWAPGAKPYQSVGMNKHPMGVDLIEVNFPDIFWRADVPKYRHILERVKE